MNGMPNLNDATLAGPDRPLRVMNTAVDLGFGILMVVSVVRYFSNHPFAGIGVWALVLGIGSTIAYAIAVLGPKNQTRETLGILVATLLWLPLVVMAPSFSWCAFALIIAVHRVLPRGWATAVSAVLVVAVSTGLFLMSQGQDLGLVLGPFFGGIVISTVYAALDRALENRRVLTDELIATRKQLALSERAAGALAERGRVASELHDTVVQRTASALLLLESGEANGRRDKHATERERDEGDADPRLGRDDSVIAEAREVLREALVETRQLLHGLQEPVHRQPLGEALARLAADHGAEYSVVGVQRDIDDDMAHALLRVAQEALVNTEKHANATTVRVTLTYFADSIGLDIADDGVGFESTRPSSDGPDQPGYGLRAMAWRIENLGGSFSLETSPGNGTVVAGIVPLEGGTHDGENQETAS